MVNYDLGFDVSQLYRCPAFAAVMKKLKSCAPTTIEEQKLLAYTLGFFGERGLEHLKETAAASKDPVAITKALESIERRIKVLRSLNHLPISCAKIKHDYQLCKELECPGAVTPIGYCFGEDPNTRRVEMIHLADLDAGQLGGYVQAEVYVCGVGEPASIPYLIEAKCVPNRGAPWTAQCSECPYSSGVEVTVNDLRNELRQQNLLIKFIGLWERGERSILKWAVNEYVKANSNCPLLTQGKSPTPQIAVKREKTITPLIVSPCVDELTITDLEARESSRRRIYIVGLKTSVARKGLIFGPVLKHPRRGTLTILATRFEPSGFGLDNFKPASKELASLTLLREKSIEELVEVVGSNICGIYGRGDAVEANLIAFHTPLYFVWKDQQIPGWVQVTNFGDTTTGKRIPRMIKQFIDLGLYVIVETSGRTGLLYFIDQSREGHILGFGEFVLADKQLVIIDGYDRMEKEERAEFRESYRQGFLKVRRVVSGTAPMRVRVIACENVKMPLSEYLYPIQSLLDNYRPPDIARIDLAIPYRTEDVSAAEIFKHPPPKPEWLSDLQRALRLSVLLAWSRRHDQVRFEPDAVETINEVAKAFDAKYGTDRIPLISKDFDKKLAKLSAGYAALRASYDADLNLIIKKEHVGHVADLIDRIYSGPGMRLNEYASVMKEQTTLSDEEFNEIKKEIDQIIEEEAAEGIGLGRPKIPIMETIMRELQARGTATLSELQAAVTDDIAGKVSQETIRSRILIFKKHRLITSGKEGYQLTPKGIQFMHRSKQVVEIGCRQ